MTTKTATKKTLAKKTPAKLTAKQLEIKKAIEEATFLTPSEKTDYLEYLAKGMVKEAPTLEHYDIKAHPRALTTPCEADARLYNEETGEFLSFEPGDLDMYEVLDTLAYACENGKLNRRSWVKTVFQTEEALEWFLDELECYDDCYRINDRWWHALACLCQHEDVEEGFISCEDIVQALREYIEYTNQAY